MSSPLYGRYEGSWDNSIGDRAIAPSVFVFDPYEVEPIHAIGAAIGERCPVFGILVRWQIADEVGGPSTFHTSNG